MQDVERRHQPSTLNVPKPLVPSYGRGTGVGIGRGVARGLAVGVGLGVELGVAVTVAVGVGVAVGVTVGLAVGVAVALGLAVAVGVVVAVAVGLGVGVGCGAPPTLRSTTIALCSPLGGKPIAAAISIRPSASKSAIVPNCGVLPIPKR